MVFVCSGVFGGALCFSLRAWGWGEGGVVVVVMVPRFRGCFGVSSLFRGPLMTTVVIELSWARVPVFPVACTGWGEGGVVTTAMSPRFLGCFGGTGPPPPPAAVVVVMVPRFLGCFGVPGLFRGPLAVVVGGWQSSNGVPFPHAASLGVATTGVCLGLGVGVNQLRLA
jgi:hypothetical protein